MRLLVSLVLTTLVASAFAQEVPAAQIEAVNELPNVDVQLVDENTFTAGDAAEETVAAVDPSSVIVSAINDAVETVAESLTLDAPVVEEEESQNEKNVPEDEPMLQPVVAETAAPDPAEMEDDEPALDNETPLMNVAEPEPEPPTTDTQGDPEFAAIPRPAAPMEEVTVEVVEKKPTKKELKAVEKFNAAVDNIANILSQRLSGEDALPIDVNEDVLEELDMEVTTLPPTTTPAITEAPEPVEKECPAKWVDKCLDEKCKGKKKCLDKCEKKGCATEKKKKNIKKNNNNKNNKRKGNNKNNNNKRKDNNNNKNKTKNNKNKTSNKNNKNKNNKNNRKNRNKNIRNRLFTTRFSSNRQSKDLDFEDHEDIGSHEAVVQGRRKGDGEKEISNKRRNGNNNNKKEKKKNKKNKKNKVNKTRSEDLEAEAKDKYVPKSAEPGPLFATIEEFSASPGMIMGFSHIRRKGDVQVNLSGRQPTFIATVVMGPLNVLLTRPTSSVRRSEVTTELTARMHFTAKEARRRDKLSINEVVVEIPENESVSVLRSDLELEPEVVSAAQDEVSSAIDTNRIARIIHQTLAEAFDEDNILQNLENHPALAAKV